MVKPAVPIDGLSRDERLALIEQLWESLNQEEGDVPVSAAQRAELAARELALRSGRLEMFPVEEVLDAIRKRRAPG